MFNQYDVYTEIKSLYCYKESHVLYNKFHIKDYNKFENDALVKVLTNCVTKSP